jgi:transposase
MSDRQDTIRMIDEAVAIGARLSKACEILGLSDRTIQRWRHNMDDGRKATTKKRHTANKLTEQERDQILEICNQGQFASMSPNHTGVSR